MKILRFILLLTFNLGFSQAIIEGYIFDQANEDPLPYATIRLLGDNSYTITNEDGKFRISTRELNDSLEITYIGYKKMRVPLSHFNSSSDLYLLRNTVILDEVTVVSTRDEEFGLELLKGLVKKYRKMKGINHSKAFLTLTSSARGIPIEQIEGFYNAKQSLSSGITELEIKSGRFGQNKTFSFYSLDNTKILTDFKFFENSNQILPLYPGNLSLNQIKRKYKVKVDECGNCKPTDLILSFTPLKTEARYFSGTILCDREKLTIKKMELWIDNPTTKELTSINERVKISPKGIKLEIVFNPFDIDKVQYLDFDFALNYEYGASKEIIVSRSFVYFYDHNISFEEPYFTNPIEFKNDYDKIIALQASEDFWVTNYQFPKSIRENRSMDFMKDYGNLFNYDNTIKTDDIKYAEPAVISWDKDRRLEWSSIKKGITVQKNSNDNPSESEILGTVKADNVYHSSAELGRNGSGIDKEQEFVFSFMLDLYENKKGEDQYVIKTLFDRNSSFCLYGRTKNKLVYINIMFDIYEYYRKILQAQISPGTTFEEARNRCDKKFEEASLLVAKMQKETSSGLNYQNLIRWNNQMKSKLNIDNFAVIE